MNAPAPESPPSFAPPKKRAWFQLHLSTCVVLMVAAGALAWTNVVVRVGLRESKWGFYGLYEEWNPNGAPPKVPIEVRGWPWVFQDAEIQYDNWISFESAEPLDQFADIAKTPNPSKHLALSEDIWRHPEAWSKLDLAKNLGVAVALLAIVAMTCEALIRRRARA